MKTYTTHGNVRGTCGHAHRSIRTALLCAVRDAESCAKQGGYSDRRVVGNSFDCYGSPRPLSEDELYTLDYAVNNLA